MEQIFFLVLVALVGLARWFLQSAENKKNAAPQESADTPVSERPRGRPAQSEEERIRKFFEALGVPPSDSPLPKVQPRQEKVKPPRPRRTILPVDPFPIPRAGGGLPPIMSAPAPIPDLPTPRPVTPAVPRVPSKNPAERALSSARMERTPTKFEVRDIDEGAIDDSAMSSSPQPESAIEQGRTPWGQAVAARIATPEALREAIVLTEIFGPPRSLQPLGHRPVG